jgi:hypothetical protein
MSSWKCCCWMVVLPNTRDRETVARAQHRHTAAAVIYVTAWNARAHNSGRETTHFEDRKLGVIFWKWTLVRVQWRARLLAVTTPLCLAPASAVTERYKLRLPVSNVRVTLQLRSSQKRLNAAFLFCGGGEGVKEAGQLIFTNCLQSHFIHISGGWGGWDISRHCPDTSDPCNLSRPSARAFHFTSKFYRDYSTQWTRFAQRLAGDWSYWLHGIRLAAIKLGGHCCYSPACPCGGSIGQARRGRVDISLCNTCHILQIPRAHTALSQCNNFILFLREIPPM